MFIKCKIIELKLIVRRHNNDKVKTKVFADIDLNIR